MTFGTKKLRTPIEAGEEEDWQLQVPYPQLEPLVRSCPFELVTGRRHFELCTECLFKSCADLRALGLNDDGNPLPTSARARCGAKTRKGSTCNLPVTPGKCRCRFHGGASTGPKTAEGRMRIAEAQRKRWASRR